MYVTGLPASHPYILTSLRQLFTPIMILPLLALVSIANAAVIKRDPSLKIVIGNDDGWATANIRSFYKALKAAGHKVCHLLRLPLIVPAWHTAY
jgi:hypothetical protein